MLLLTTGRGHRHDAPVAAAGASGHTEGAAAACQHCRPETGNGAGERGCGAPHGADSRHTWRASEMSSTHAETPPGLAGSGGGWQLLPLLPPGCHHQVIPTLLSAKLGLSPNSQAFLRLSLQEADLITLFSPNCSLTVAPPPSARLAHLCCSRSPFTFSGPGVGAWSYNEREEGGRRGRTQRGPKTRRPFSAEPLAPLLGDGGRGRGFLGWGSVQK